MKITILTLFPEMFDGFLTNSIIGGGAGLIMKCQPIVDALKNNANHDSFKILLSPKGKQYSQQNAINFAKMDDIVLLCGHYEGIDERVNDYVDELVSIGDYVLSGGELGAMVIADSIIRLQDGAITDASLDEETFSDSLLEYPQYTEPKEFDGKKVPDILYTGNHEAINKYRRKESLRITRDKRPDLFAKHKLTKQDQKLLKEIDEEIDEPKWLVDAINKGKKFL